MISEQGNIELQNRIKIFKENYTKVSFEFENEYEYPVLDPLRYEICLCIFFNLSQAAITLTNHLIESALKRILSHNDFYIDYKKNPELGYLRDLPKYFKKYDSNNLYDNIKKAFSKGLINETEKKELLRIKEAYRNAYSHADKSKTFKDQKDIILELGLNENGEMKNTEHEINIKEMPLFQGIFQAIRAENEAVEYFKFIDSLIRKLLKKEK